MAFDSDGLQVMGDNANISTGKASVRRAWWYVTNDALSVVETDGYFDAVAGSMNTGDVILCSFDNDGTEGHKLLMVTATDTDVAVASGHGVAALTDSSGGTADGTVAAISGSGADADINNNFAELAAKVNALAAAL